MMRLVIVDSDRDFSAKVVEEARRTGDIDVAAVLHEDQGAVETVRRCGANLVLVQLSSPSVDGAALVRRLRKEAVPSTIFVMARAAEETLLTRTVELGADYCVIRPFDVPTLLRRMRQFARPGPAALAAGDEFEQEQVVTAIVQRLDALGVPRHFKGYQYLVDAIRLVVYDVTLLHTVTKELYPSVARRHNTSSERVERAIRNAIEVTMTRGNLDQIHRAFGYLLDGKKGKPTNSSFIGRLADQVRLQLRVG